MSEVSVSRFHDMSAELAMRIEDTLAGYAREHGQVYNAMAMSQSHLSVRELAQDALTFGMDVWTQGSGEDGDLGGNVIRLPFGRKPHKPRMFAGVRMALSIVGAVVGSTIIAAATTDYVDIPGFHHVANYVFSKNAPPESERIVEQHGRMVRMRFTRRPGEPWDVIHLESVQPLSEPEVARVLNDGTEANDPAPHS